MSESTAAAGADQGGIPAWVELLHELRTPLAALLAASEDMDAHGDDGRAVRAGIEHLAAVVSRAEAALAPEPRVETAPIAIVSVVDTVIAALRPLFAARGISVAVHAAPGGGPCQGLGDATALARVLVNLLGNAARYAAPGGQVEVRVWAEAGRMRIRVSDDGPGLDSTADEEGGWGIGLVVASRLMERMGGHLAAVPAPGGAVFDLDLPAS